MCIVALTSELARVHPYMFMYCEVSGDHAKVQLGWRMFVQLVWMMTSALYKHMYSGNLVQQTIIEVNDVNKGL